MDEQTSQSGPGLRTSPTGRIPQWVLDEAARRETPPSEWRTWSPPAPTAAGRRGSALRAVLVVALVLGLGLVATEVLGLRIPGGISGVAEAAPGFPTPGHDSEDEPLGAPLPAPAGGGTHAFAARQPGGEDPVAYDPCRPIHYVVRPDHAPVGGEAVLQDAVERISEVTGLQFVHDGPTDERPTRDREPYQPDRYGDRWAPVVIAWETTEENPTFLTAVAGEAGSQWMSIAGGPGVLVTGAVSLDEAEFDRILAAPGGEALARAIVLHELAHLVGLDHVADPAQLMYPTASDVLDFAPGDLTGLAALGAGACEPAL
ncbi:matrixin family metalloprotease [Candidatus Blastococcus massiliensis]|uniref:matrixin family metalloprotease n=1 Tax=Candidatus Blastococcus massiliensis TaxID=1470358 RepID=UPI0004B99620|nr:matrixin family metalloprotease [Candidatus Blastococcus massiliensis]